MTELQKRLDSAFRLLSKLSVSGDVVDIMYAVRKELREAYKLAGDKDKPEEAEEAENG